MEGFRTGHPSLGGDFEIIMGLVVKVKKLDPRAIMPRYALTGDAGLDLFCLEGATIRPGERHIFRTGVAMEIPIGHVGLVWDRSGHSNKRGLKMFGGVFDSGYRGEILVCLYNSTHETVEIEAKSAVAQMLIQRVESVEVVEADILGEGERGERRFGSTGL